MARALSFASVDGTTPYTYGQAHTLSPRACSAATSEVENCGHIRRPSELLTNTVSMPCSCANEAIASGSPPLDFETYQIHIPSPSNGDVVGGAGVATCPR